MRRVNEEVLESAIRIQLLEYQGKEIPVDELVKDLIDAGFIDAYIRRLIWLLFTERQGGVLLRGAPSGTSVMMPEDFQPSESLAAAHRRVAEKAARKGEKVLPTYFEIVTAGQ